MHQEGHVAAQVGGQFAVFGGQQESFGGSVGALLLSGRVHFFNSFGAVVQHDFTVPLERQRVNKADSYCETKCFPVPVIHMNLTVAPIRLDNVVQ